MQKDTDIMESLKKYEEAIDQLIKTLTDGFFWAARKVADNPDLVKQDNLDLNEILKNIRSDQTRMLQMREMLLRDGRVEYLN